MATSMKSTYSEAYQTLILWLAAMRKRKGMSQASLAAALGKPQSFISKVESGERRLDVLEFLDWCRLLEEHPHTIIDVLWDQGENSMRRLLGKRGGDQ